jgi:glycosyltransferase involved in cell wall biosynthesis
LINTTEKHVDKNILFIGPINDAGGIGAVFKNYKAYFRDAKYISTYPNDANSKRIFEFIKAIINIIKTLKSDKNVQILHIHCASKGSFYRKSVVLLIGKWQKKKIIMHMHGGGFKDFYYKNRLNKIYIRAILGLADKIICLSKEWHEFYSSAMNLKNTVVIGNSVELKKICGKQRFSGKIKLLFMGKICIEKGIFDLIKFLAANKIFLEGKIKLTICGTGEDEKLKRLISTPIFINRVEYHGWVEGAKKESLIKESDIYILPSHFEGVPISILEAMAYGKPIIATNVGGIPSLVKDKHNGWIIEPWGLNKLDNIFDEIMEDPKVLEKLGKNSYLEALAYDPMKMFKKMENVYTNLLNY